MGDQRSFYADKGDVNPLSGPEPVDTPDSKTVVVDGKVINTYPPLEEASKEARTWISARTQAYVQSFNGYKAKAAAQLASADQEYHKVITEPLLPNSLYVITATLFGSIWARRRGFTARFFAPLAFGLVSFRIFMPESAKNCEHCIANAEAKQFPELKKQQDAFKTSASETWESSKKEVLSYNDKLTAAIANGRKQLEQWLKK